MKYILEGLDCPNCAAKIEMELNKLEGAGDILVNFANSTVSLNPRLAGEAQRIISRIEPGVVLKPLQKESERKSEEKNPLSGRQIIFIAIASLAFALGMIFRRPLQNTPYLIGEYAVFLFSYLLVGAPVVVAAFKNIGRGKFFDENFLMTIATLGALAVHQLPEAAGVMLFYAVGEFFQDIAVYRSRSSIAALMDVRPDYANLIVDGVSTKVAPEEVKVGQIIEIKPGEKVPLDGRVIEGSSFVDTSALTGESVPRKVDAGEEIMSGVINVSGLLKVEVAREFAESSVAKILELVENASARKAPTEKFITKFAGWYTPAVVFGAVAVAVIPPLVLPGATFSSWFYRALILLVISCPCALVISIPLGYFGGIGASSRAGILVKGANFLETLTKVHTVVFDKTGTLTKGVFKVTSVISQNGFTKEEVLRWAAAAEVHSSHPIARSVSSAYDGAIDPREIENYEEIKGHGVIACAAGRKILAGNDRLLRREKVTFEACEAPGTLVYLAVDGIYAGCLVIADETKEEAAGAIARLKKLGVNKIVMLTGDNSYTAENVAGKLGIDAYFAGLLPQDKVKKVEELEDSLPEGQKLVFVGDGINDAPVITRADIGAAMGALGSDAAIEAADVVLMDDNPAKLPRAISIAGFTRKIVMQNIVLALGVKGIFVVMGVFGAATMWEAVFADVGVALLAVLNSARTLRHTGA